MSASESDRLLISRIRTGDAQAWQEFIGRYEGRMLAYVDSRLRNQSASEDVVQETFLGFLTSLPNYDESTPLESFLFAIAAHKLTDHLRREGRRPTIPLFVNTDTQSGHLEPAGDARAASSLVRSQEGRVAEHHIISSALQELIAGWLAKEEYERLMCLELLFVLGWSNKDVAARLNISEQTVANHKHFVVTKLKEAAARSNLRNVDLTEFGIQ